MSLVRKFTQFWLICFVCATVITAQTSQQESPAEKRAKEVVSLIDSGNRAEFKKYAEKSFAPGFLSMPMEQHMSFFSSVVDITRGLEYNSVQEEKPNEATLILKSKLTGESLALFVRVEPETPHLIAAMRLRTAKPPAAEPAKKIANEQIAQEIEVFVSKLVGADVFSGAVLLAKDGAPIFKGAFGMANKDFSTPNLIDTKFNLGSMNKMFTAVAIAQLVERGKLSFDDPLSKFLPDFPDSASAKKIRIKHLLTHTAGLGGYFTRQWDESSRALYRTIDDMIKRAVTDERLLFEPGTRWQYSNTGFLVLGKVIEKVTGQSYYEYVRENITKLAGMNHTDCYELDKVNPNLAVGYDKEYTDHGVSFTNNIFMHVMKGGPHGGGYSTVEDLLKFDLALRSNKLIGSEYVKQLLSAKPDLNSPTYGYGFQVDPESGIVGHGGGFPGVNSNLDMFLGTGWTAIVMSNYSRGAQAIQQKIRNLVQIAREGK